MNAEMLAYLRARLGEVEQAAHDAGGEAWMWMIQEPTKIMVPTLNGPGWYLIDVPTRGIRDHIVRHPPTRVLAEVEAKRRILDCVERDLADDPTDESAVHLVRLLALPYASRFDFPEGLRLAVTENRLEPVTAVAGMTLADSDACHLNRLRSIAAARGVPTDALLDRLARQPDPTEVNWVDVKQAFADLGIDLVPNTESVEILPDLIRVTRIREPVLVRAVRESTEIAIRYPNEDGE